MGRTGLGVLASLGIFACTSPPPATVIAEIADGRYVTHTLPPLNSGCGRIQPGYDPGDPSADPPIPPTLPGTNRACSEDAECASGASGEICREGHCRAVYDPFADTFCSVSWTYRFSMEGGTPYWSFWAYVVDMGDPDPTIEPPPHLAALLPAAHDSALYCSFRWRVDAVEAVGTYSQSELQHLRMVLEEVSEFCSVAYAPGAYCPERDAPAGCIDPGTGEPTVDTFEGYLFRSSDPDVVLFLDTPRVADMGDDLRFQGFALMPETGGIARPGQPGGWAFFYLPCDEARASADGQGPGFCTPCRYGSATNTLPECRWEDVRALPADPALVHPAWVDDHPDIYLDVHGGT